MDAGGGYICRFIYDGDGVRRKRLDDNGTIHYLGGYERNVGNGVDATEVITKYYNASFGKLSRLIAFRKAGLLYFVGSDHLGSTIRVADSGFVAVDQMRYSPFGSSRDAGVNLKTDHKYTGQIEDAYINLYHMGARSYDPVLGRFISPDTIVPDSKNPQSLNRYAYCFNNPLKYTDPTGHDPSDWDPAWVQEFTKNHGFGPNEQDWQDRLFSLANPGSGPNGSWTQQDWNAYYTAQVQQILGTLLNHVGNDTYGSFDLNSFGGIWNNLFSGARMVRGPDGTWIVVEGRNLEGTGGGWASGDVITLRVDIAERWTKNGTADPILIHEYVHALQERAVGQLFWFDYIFSKGGVDKSDRTSWDRNAYEVQAMAVQDIYWRDPSLPPPWEFLPSCGPWYGATP